MYVTARAGEPFAEPYRRFKREVEGSGVLREYRRDKIRAAARKKKRAAAKSGGRDR